MAEDGIDQDRYQFWMQGANIIRRAEALFIALSISSSVGRGRQAGRLSPVMKISLILNYYNYL
ncbi:MAG: hypothetical protein ABSH41_05980 [Syntrophobacteraceae bacterium]